MVLGLTKFLHYLYVDLVSNSLILTTFAFSWNLLMHYPYPSIEKLLQNIFYLYLMILSLILNQHQLQPYKTCLIVFVSHDTCYQVQSVVFLISLVVQLY